MPYLSHSDIFNPYVFLENFDSILDNIAYTPRNPLNTEMFFMWCMIQTFKPDLFIESGTYKGYSANFICEGLKHTSKDVNFVTYGYNLEDCIPYAIDRLSIYEFANVIEGNSCAQIRDFKGEKRSTAFFIDGPKGKNLPFLLFSINELFENIAFIAVHDCERESGSNNRWYIEHFANFGYSLLYCDASFQEEFTSLDKTLIGSEDMSMWQPYQKSGKPTASYGTGTGYLIPHSGNRSEIRNQYVKLWLKIWFYLYPRVQRRIRTNNFSSFNEY